MPGLEIMDENEIRRLVGTLLIVGFEGTSVTPNVRALIQDHNVGTILLSNKNLTSAGQATQLVRDLQEAAFQAGHIEPLLIAIDQENGCVNSLVDPANTHQFPSAMAMVACNSLDLARNVASATARELHCVGINWILGPVLDVLSNTRTQPLGVRSLGDDPIEVAKYGLEYIRGYHDGGIATCGKHFPSYGNLEFLGSTLDMPIMSGTIEQLRLNALVPFEAGIQGSGTNSSLDAVMVGACGMPNINDGEVKYACLSRTIVSDLLRSELGFQGVVLSGCLEIETLYDDLGVGQATIMGLDAGCDMFMVCNSFSNQMTAINGLVSGVKSDIITVDRLRESAARVSKLKSTYTNWSTVLNPAGIEGLRRLEQAHSILSTRAYETSISLVRDSQRLLPLPQVGRTNRLVLLTPLIEILTGEEQHSNAETSNSGSTIRANKHRSDRKTAFHGEETFRGLGLSIAKRWSGKVLHTSYTASGIRPTHEELISTADTVIVLTADGVRNAYQYGFTKYVASLCKSQASASYPDGTPFIVVAVSSPFDFIKDDNISTYLCTYDFTPIAMESLVRVLFGDIPAGGSAPSTKVKRAIEAAQKKPRKQLLWLVEEFDPMRDMEALQHLLDRVYYHASGNPSHSVTLPVHCTEASIYHSISNSMFDEHHFIVRNSSTKEIHGFCATYCLKMVRQTAIGCLVVSPERRRTGIGRSLCAHALKYYLAEDGVSKVQFGSDVPSIFPGVPRNLDLKSADLKAWTEERGWGSHFQERTIRTFHIVDLQQWTPLPTLLDRFKATKIGMLTWQQSNSPKMLAHLEANSTLYDFALANRQGCRILVMLDPNDTSIIGSCLLYDANSRVAKFFPTGSNKIAGITGIVIRPGEMERLLLQSLLATSITHLKAAHNTGVQLHVFDDNPPQEMLREAGFELTFEFKSMISTKSVHDQ